MKCLPAVPGARSVESESKANEELPRDSAVRRARPIGSSVMTDLCVSKLENGRAISVAEGVNLHDKIAQLSRPSAILAEPFRTEQLHSW